ncbi:TetR/AcrR family transcriptional regulator [Nocardia paucivorans]|uniref:TetR/AcrR family transcriptional regulator n=1 Tax=Nocardia paucivorans TaxID=114259 RepID=UPI0005935E04|nr:TetR/AcrR family transcriptional regulator [Nocardia paucivorans]
MTASPRANRGPRAAAGNRAALIAAARTLFADKGSGVPMSAIARAAGVGQGVLYRHFPTRGRLAAAVFEENICAVEARAADPSTTVDDVLRILVDQVVASAAFIMMLDPTGVDDPRVAETAARLRELLTRKLADPGQRGDIAADVTADDIVLVVGMLAGLVSKTAGEVRRAHAERAWALLYRGLRG